MKRWCKQMSMYCSMATTNGYCQVTACMHMAEPMPICNDENAVMPYETPKVNLTASGYIPIEWINKWTKENTYVADVIDMVRDWEKENEI